MTVNTVNRSTAQLTIYEISAVQDDVWYLSLSQDTTWDQVLSVTAFVEGSANFDRSDGQRGPFYTPGAIRQAGDSNLDFPVPMMPAGRFRYTVTTPTFKYYCLLDPQNRSLQATTVRLANGATYTPAVGRRLFLAMGQITVADTSYSAPATVDIATAGTVVTVVVDGTLILELAALS
jgi:hypothetical protein